jgi:hypothetical protein
MSIKSTLLGPLLIGLPLLASCAAVAHADSIDSEAQVIVAEVAAPDQQPAIAGDRGKEVQLSPEEKMRRRFPQPIIARDLIGLPVLDDDDVTIGYVQHVVRTPEGKIQLIVPYGGWFGWGQRPVAVPIELVTILGRQLDSLDMSRDEFDAAPTWQGSQGQPIDSNEIIRIALGRR